ncbi:MAG: hypothetical protein PVF18_13485 [Anaerolineales bacterium]|jgi:hypothetical protein
MSKDSGFVPIPFHIVGKILLLIGLTFLAAYAVSFVSNWFILPAITFLFALSTIIIGLYLMYIVPRESID